MWNNARMKVKDIMHTRMTKVSLNTTAEEASQIMVTAKVGALLAEKNGEIKGIVTQGDIVSKVVAKEKKPDEVYVSEILNNPLVMIDEEADILEASDLMTKYGIRRLIAVRKGQIVGIISSKVIGAKIRTLLYEYTKTSSKTTNQ